MMDVFQYMKQNGETFWAEQPMPDKMVSNNPFPTKGPTLTQRQMDSGQTFSSRIFRKQEEYP